MDQLWKFKSLAVKIKLKYWNMICKSKLAYALQTIPLKTGQISKLQALQMKGLRKILGFQHPFVNRGNTNARVLMHTNLHLKEDTKVKNRSRREKAKELGKKYVPLTHTNVTLIGTDLLKTRIRYLGHIIRCHQEDPLRRTTFKKHRITGNYHRKKRVGRPRLAWVDTTSKASWTSLKRHFIRSGKPALAAQRYDATNKVHRRELAQAARARIF